MSNISVECSAGTFYDHETLTCPPCERGFYQSLPGQILCNQCPGNTTTKSVNSKSITDCTGKEINKQRYQAKPQIIIAFRLILIVLNRCL